MEALEAFIGAALSGAVAWFIISGINSIFSSDKDEENTK